jgi:hypothetical protein
MHACADCSLLLEERLEEAGGSGRSVQSDRARARITCFNLHWHLTDSWMIVYSQ